MNARQMMVLAVALAATHALAAPADPQGDRLRSCMALKPASPDQKRCLDELRAMMAAKPAAPVPAPQPAAAAAVTDTRGQPPSAPAPEVPKDVKAAAALLGVAGKASPTAPVKPIDISGLDPATAMRMVQAQQALVLEAQMKAMLAALEKRNAALAGKTQEAIREQEEIIRTILESRNQVIDAVLKMLQHLQQEQARLQAAGFKRG